MTIPETEISVMVGFLVIMAIICVICMVALEVDKSRMMAAHTRETIRLEDKKFEIQKQMDRMKYPHLFKDEGNDLDE